MSEKQWNRIKDKFPPEKTQGGRPGKSNREMLNAILYWLNTGIPWRDLPERFGPWQSVYSRFRAWTKAGVWEDILTALIEQDFADKTTLMLNSKHYDQSPPACRWGQKRGYHEETRRSRGGLTTKVHAVTDGLGNPLRFLLSSGNQHDICMAQALSGGESVPQTQNNRRFATRYEKNALYFRAVVCLACSNA